tara:strand:+ start:254 stop:538 length:285 start_codon:yes stop_codon:yes gene_type:complete
MPYLNLRDDIWDYETEYNLIKEKELIKFIDSLETPVRRMEIQEVADTIRIPSRTLSDILKRNVQRRNIKKLAHGIYASKNFSLDYYNDRAADTI